MDQPQHINQFAAAFDTARTAFTAGIEAEEAGNMWDSHSEFIAAANGFDLARKFAFSDPDRVKATRWATSARRNADKYQH